MKETKADASAAYAAVNNLQPTSIEARRSASPQIPHFSGLPAVRPTPVGSECVDEPSISFHSSHLHNIATNKQISPLQETNNQSSGGNIYPSPQQYPISSVAAQQFSGTTNFYPHQYTQTNPMGYQQPSVIASAVGTNFSTLNAVPSAIQPSVKDPYLSLIHI